MLSRAENRYFTASTQAKSMIAQVYGSTLCEYGFKMQISFLEVDITVVFSEVLEDPQTECGRIRVFIYDYTLGIMGPAVMDKTSLALR